MELLDVVLYSVSNGNKLNTILKTIFLPNKFILYDLNKENLLNKSWYNSFRIAVIDCSEMNPIDENIYDIIKTIICDRKQLILLTENFQNDIIHSNKDMEIENINDTITIAKFFNKTHLILFKNIKELCDNSDVIIDLLNLKQYSNNEIQFHHGDVFVFSKTKDKMIEYLFKLKLYGCNDEPVNYFKYNSLELISHLPKSLSDNIETKYKLLSYSKEKNDELIELSSFKTEEYFASLYTKYLGKIVIFSDVLASSFDFLERLVQLGNYDPIVIISHVQTQGKGRSLNKWISPMGCAMFSCLIPIEVNSILGNSMSLIQHITAVSIVEAINFTCWIDEDAIKIKWPNDVYWKDHGKISGILLKAFVHLNTFYSILGCGINVANTEPTVCIYDIIKEYNKGNVKTFKYPSIEEIIAHVITRLESNILSIQSNENGIKNFQSKYYKYWMHKDQIVTYHQGDDIYIGKIIGIDNFGFLQIMSNDQSIISLHPDGNSFDMMHNLIFPK